MQVIRRNDDLPSANRQLAATPSTRDQMLPAAQELAGDL
jgi:hypothetical protein